MEPRNYLAGAGATPPDAPASPSNGYPQAGVPGVSEPTTPGPFWFYKFGEESRAIIVLGGLTPDDATLNQMALAIQAIAADVGDLRYLSQSAAASGYVPVGGSHKNLVVQPNVAASTTKIDFTADEAILKTGIGGLAYLAPNVNVTLDVTTVGAGGLDVAYAGTPAIHYGFLISDGATTQAFASTSQTPTLPAGYTMSELVSAFYISGAAGSPSILGFYQEGKSVWMVEYTVLNYVVPTVAGTYQSVSVPAASGVPPIAKTVSGTFFNNGNLTRLAAKNAAGVIVGQRTWGIGAGSGGFVPFNGLPLSTGGVIWWTNTGGGYTSSVYLSGFTLP